MEYTTKKLQSDPGMTQSQALLSLQESPAFVPGTKIASVLRRGNAWVAELKIPKTAGEPPFPPKEDEGGSSEDEGAPTPPSDDGAPEGLPTDDGGLDEALDGPPSPDGGDDGEKKPKGKGGTEEAILHTLTQILHALQGGGVPEGLGGGSDALDLGPGGPPAPVPPKGGLPGAGGPPHGAPGGAPKFPPKPMKPGDTPPGGTPIGAPAFASTKQALGPGVAPAVGTPVPTGQAGPTGTNVQAGVCPKDGNPEPCPIHSGQAAGGLAGQVASYSNRAATITLSTDGMSVKQAVAEARPVVEAYGYSVKQAKRGDGQIHILATRR